jgi:hypothetical protein
MKKFLIITIVFLFSMPLSAHNLQPIKLSKPNMSLGKSMMQSLQDRRSDREYSDKQLSIDVLSDLL